MNHIPSRIFKVAAYALAGLSIYSSVALGAGPKAGSTPLPPSSDDIASYIMRVGGWLSDINMPGDTTSHYWTQVSYSVSDKAPSSSTIGTTSILVLTVTRAILQRTALSSPFTTCSQSETISQTITFDPRDISKDTTETSSPAATTPDPNDLTMPPSTPPLWKVNFQVYPRLSGARPFVVRQVTTVTAPPTCPPISGKVDTSTTISDSPGFSIEFARKDQADYLVALVKATWIDAPWPPK